MKNTIKAMSNEEILVSVQDELGSKLSMVVMSNLSDIEASQDETLGTKVDFVKWVILISGGDLSMRVDTTKLIEAYHSVRGETPEDMERAKEALLKMVEEWKSEDMEENSSYWDSVAENITSTNNKSKLTKLALETFGVEIQKLLK